MYIFFYSITYENKPILWSYSEGSATAQCCYKLAGEKDLVEHQLINNCLTGIPGIEIRNGIATIPDFDNFKTKYPFNFVLPLDIHRATPASPSSIRSSTFFAPRSEHPIPIPSSTRSNIPSSPRARSPRVRFALTFMSLMEPYQGETLIYDPAADPNIIANNENNLEKLLRLKVHSLASINLTLQVINNINLYIIRQQQINALKCLFDQELIPAINEFQKDGKIPGDVLEYFALAVRDIMVNSKLNNKDTLFELNFKENNEPIPVEFNYEIRAVYAKKMISSLSYLVNERIEPDTQDLELRRWLINFKRHLHLNDESIRKYSLRTKDLAFIRKTISSLEQSIVCSGLIDHDYRLIKTDDLIENGQLDFALLVAAIGAMHEGETTLRYALERLDKESYQIPERIGISIPEPLTSLSCIIKTWFQTILSQTTKDKLKEQGLINLVKKILNVVIPLFSSATKGDSRCVEARFISHTIHTSDTDVYVTRIWKEALNECFLRETPHLNQKVKEKVKPEKLQHLLFKITQDVLNEQLKLLLTAEHDIQSQASCSSSSSV